ncbi:MAG: DUF58 domain-containing protein [Chloroflexi bacterium]|nr:DUF58 domain-containing protein [Chloroflexota bacterium]
MKVRKILIIIPVALLILSFILGSGLLLKLFILSALMLLLGYVWTLLAARGIRVQSGAVPERSQVGARFDQEFAVFNDSRLPKFLLNLEEDTNIPGYRNLRVLNIPPRSSIHWQSNVNCQRRGRYRLGSTTIMSGDPFGFFRQDHSFGEAHDLIVYPDTLELPFFEASVPSNPHGSSIWLSGHTGINASSVRESTWGDSLSRIHWPSTARAGKLMVKVFENDRSAALAENILVLLDMDRTAHAGQDNESTEEYAITIAASLIKKYIDNGMSAGLIASSDPPCSFRPARDQGDYHRMMEALALVHANGKLSIEHIIANEMGRIGSGSAVVIISPASTPGLVDSIRQLKARSNTVAVVWLESGSFGGATDSPNIAHILNQLSIQVYLVRRGDDLVRVLNRRTPVPVRYA